MSSLKILQDDTYLQPFEFAITGRHDYAVRK